MSEGKGRYHVIQDGARHIWGAEDGAGAREGNTDGAAESRSDGDGAGNFGSRTDRTIRPDDGIRGILDHMIGETEGNIGSTLALMELLTKKYLRLQSQLGKLHRLREKA